MLSRRNKRKITESNVDKYADSQYVGKWVAAVAEYEGVEYDAKEIFGAVELIFNVDGTGKFAGDDGEDSFNVDTEWEPTEDGLKMMSEDGEDHFTYKDGKLLMDLETEEVFMTVYFENQK